MTMWHSLRHLGIRDFGMALFLTALLGGGGTFAAQHSELIARLARLVGPTFPALFAGSTLGVAVALQILLRLRAHRSRPTRLDTLQNHFKTYLGNPIAYGEIQNAMELVRQPQGLVERATTEALDLLGAIRCDKEIPHILESLAIRHTAPLTGGMGLLSLVLVATPLIGLLGTVLGLAEGMGHINGNGGNIQRLAGSIGNSLWSTIVATVIVLGLYPLQGLIDARLTRLHHQLSETIALLEAVFARQLHERQERAAMFAAETPSVENPIVSDESAQEPATAQEPLPLDTEQAPLGTTLPDTIDFPQNRRDLLRFVTQCARAVFTAT